MMFRRFIPILFLLSLAITHTAKAESIVYEDAEQGDTALWGIYDNTPQGASISNVFDAEKNSNVILFSSTKRRNGFRLGHNRATHPAAWGNTSNKVISWESKFDDNFVVYIPVQTTLGFRYLYYTAISRDAGIHANPKYIHHGLGSNRRNGEWNTIYRDLQADLEEFEPGNQVLSVNGFLIRGSGRVDNIALLDAIPPAPTEIIYEDAENSNTTGWDIYDKTPAGATISNVFDNDTNSRVISITGTARRNGFRLGHNSKNSVRSWNNTIHKEISWDSKFNNHFTVYIPVQTEQGFRYLYYTSIDTDRGIHANAKYIHHGVGSDKKDGVWHTITRNLESDLQDFEPDNHILAVTGFLIRGTGFLDNIKLFKTNSVNTAPVANPQAVINIDENSVDNMIIISGSDADGDPLSFNITQTTNNGTLSGTAPNLTYTPNVDYFGSDSFSFTVNDGTDTSAPVTINIEVTQTPNSIPVAIPQGPLSVNENSANNEIILTGSDADGDTLSFNITQTTNNGTLSGTAPNLTYTPNVDYFGADSFSFTVNDGIDTSAAVTVSITVIETPNTVPNAISQTVTVNENSANNVIVLTGNDADNDGLTYQVVNSPLHGTLNGIAPNLSYTPNQNYDGTDSFTFTVNDGTDTSAVATVSITVLNVNQAPTANAGANTSVEVNNPVTLTGSGLDPDGTISSFSWTENGIEIATTASFVYTPTIVGTHTLTLTVTDNENASGSATVDIEATPAVVLSAFTCNASAASEEDWFSSDYYITSLKSDREWSGNVFAPISVQDIENEFNNGRIHDGNIMSGKALKMPEQAVWDSYSDAQKALFLINSERCIRNIRPYEGIDLNVVQAPSQAYANLLASEVSNPDGGLSHDLDRTPFVRLAEDAGVSVGTNADFFSFAENLSLLSVSSSGGYINNYEAVARSVYAWLYADKTATAVTVDGVTSYTYGHRKFLLATGLNENSGLIDQEGLLSLAISSKQTTSNVNDTLFYNTISYIVLNGFDPNENWNMSNIESVNSVEPDSCLQGLTYTPEGDGFYCAEGGIY